ncbi:fungal-specific transcription factor domain-containing protein [Bombardia bombarda]|uniref:Fungal-specific transcription factor domain-containing protein n=1 Tax=Bombardia bombarda TaxID=252184 RepID=A0AA39XPD8_9PEZI|nr:fungal-specific transcription factor domain-containing protein [Bombardia bombarda]
MKNRQKSRSGCRTCKLRRLRCDETKPACRNCTQKGLECPGYQQRLQWSTKHERSFSASKPTAPINFTQLVSAASESISQSLEKSPPPPRERGVGHDGDGDGGDDASSRASVAVSDSASSPQTSVLSPSRSRSSSTSPISPTEEPSTALVTVSRNSPAAPPQQQQTQELPGVPLWQPVVDIPSFLIEHWFKSVCGSWSAFDSQTNPYRRLTSTLWSTSTPVFYALQAISAASLVERLPLVMRETAKAAPRLATDAIRKELVAFSSGRYRQKFPSELLLSLFCMSSSMCWMESRQLGRAYVRQARAILKSLDRDTLNKEDQELLDFFNGCLIYEEMLRSVVSDDEIDFENMLSWPEPSTQGPVLPASPHAWTGVSATVLRLFGKAVALCRRSRSRWKHNDGTSYRVIQGAIRDIEEATVVEEALLAIEILDQSDRGEMSDPARNLYAATESYRLSSLLQLYETFPDLITKRIPTLVNADGAAVWEAWVSPLALHIADVLQQLPASSLRCIQPLLYLCAGSGLRFETKVPFGNGHNNYLLSTETTAPLPSIAVDGSLRLPGPKITENAIKISRARQFLMSRLDELEITLPPKPIGVAKQLLRAVWSAYDEEIDTPRRTHWLDVMDYTGLHSLFG